MLVALITGFVVSIIINLFKKDKSAKSDNNKADKGPEENE